MLIQKLYIVCINMKRIEGEFVMVRILKMCFVYIHDWVSVSFSQQTWNSKNVFYSTINERVAFFFLCCVCDSKWVTSTFISIFTAVSLFFFFQFWIRWNVVPHVKMKWSRKKSLIWHFHDIIFWFLTLFSSGLTFYLLCLE